MKKRYIKKAAELCYDPAIFKEIMSCKTEEEITRKMITYRRRLP